MDSLKGYQKKYLKGVVHGAKPVAFVGQRGLTTEVAKAIDECLNTHEAIKVKFIDFKEKQHKKALCGQIEQETTAVLVGIIGHVAIFYRQHKDPQKRKIHLPVR